METGQLCFNDKYDAMQTWLWCVFAAELAKYCERMLQRWI